MKRSDQARLIACAHYCLAMVLFVWGVIHRPFEIGLFVAGQVQLVMGLLAIVVAYLEDR